MQREDVLRPPFPNFVIEFRDFFDGDHDELTELTSARASLFHVINGDVCVEARLERTDRYWTLLCALMRRNSFGTPTRHDLTFSWEQAVYPEMTTVRTKNSSILCEWVGAGLAHAVHLFYVERYREAEELVAKLSERVSLVRPRIVAEERRTREQVETSVTPEIRVPQGPAFFSTTFLDSIRYFIMGYRVFQQGRQGIGAQQWAVAASAFIASSHWIMCSQRRVPWRTGLDKIRMNADMFAHYSLARYFATPACTKEHLAVGICCMRKALHAVNGTIASMSGDVRKEQIEGVRSLFTEHLKRMESRNQIQFLSSAVPTEVRYLFDGDGANLSADLKDELVIIAGLQEPDLAS
jgi:hypothetical protein